MYGLRKFDSKNFLPTTSNVRLLKHIPVQKIFSTAFQKLELSPG